MRNIVRENPKAFVLALVVHLVLIAALAISVDWQTKHKLAGSEVKVIQAVMIDESKIKAEQERKRKLEEDRRKKLEQEKRRKDEERRKQELKKKQELEKQRKAEAEKKRKLAEAEKKRKAETEKKRKQEELKKKQEAEKKRLAELEEKRKIEAERLRQLEEKRKAEAERRAEEERLRQQQMAEEAAAMAAARQRVLQSERDKYIDMIAMRVASKWLKPSGWRAGTECTVTVRLVPGAGTAQVIDARLAKSCGNPLFDRSVENAVYTASPLPIPSAPELINEFREITFNFRPEE